MQLARMIIVLAAGILISGTKLRDDPQFHSDKKDVLVWLFWVENEMKACQLLGGVAC